MLATNLKGDDKNLFYDYLNSCCEIILKSKDNNNDLYDEKRAIEVFDLDKIKNFKAPEMKKISTLDLDKEENTTISSNNEINTNKQNNSPQLEKNRLEQDKVYPQIPQ